MHWEWCKIFEHSIFTQILLVISLRPLHSRVFHETCAFPAAMSLNDTILDSRLRRSRCATSSTTMSAVLLPFFSMQSDLTQPLLQLSAYILWVQLKHACFRVRWHCCQMQHHPRHRTIFSFRFHNFDYLTVCFPISLDLENSVITRDSQQTTWVRWASG